jgi:hypothetical protein
MVGKLGIPDELAAKERREHKDFEVKWRCFVESLLTGRHEIMKTGRE